MSSAVAEVETPPVTGDEGLVPSRSGRPSQIDRWMQDPKSALEKIDTMVELLEKLRVASIRATLASDWIIHTSTDSDGTILREVGYLQDCGAERAGKVWGVEVGKADARREDAGEGTYIYKLEAEAWSKVTGEVIPNVMGARWSGDKFFTRGLEEGEKADPSDVAKAAYANLHGRAVRALGGLSAVSLDTLKAAGVDISKVVHVGYGKGAKGGQSTGAGVGGTDVTVGFGQQRGAKVADLPDKDLTWYLKAYGENVEDPSKEKFRKANLRVLEALKAESERRKQKTQHTADTGTETKPEGAAGAPDAPPTKGQRLSELRGRLLIALGKNEKALAPLLRELTKEAETSANVLSDLTDDQIDWISTIPATELKATADEILRSLKK